MKGRMPAERSTTTVAKPLRREALYKKVRMNTRKNKDQC